MAWKLGSCLAKRKRSKGGKRETSYSEDRILMLDNNNWQVVSGESRNVVRPDSSSVDQISRGYKSSVFKSHDPVPLLLVVSDFLRNGTVDDLSTSVLGSNNESLRECPGRDGSIVGSMQRTEHFGVVDSWRQLSHLIRSQQGGLANISLLKSQLFHAGEEQLTL